MTTLSLDSLQQLEISDCYASVFPIKCPCVSVLQTWEVVTKSLDKHSFAGPLNTYNTSLPTHTNNELVCFTKLKLHIIHGDDRRNVVNRQKQVTKAMVLTAWEDRDVRFLFKFSEHRYILLSEFL